MTRVAAVDCGTNTIRLLVADIVRDVPADAVRLRSLHRSSTIVRLGQGVDHTGRLDPDALARTLAVVREYAATCADLEVPLDAEHARFVATSATRDAENRDEFVDGVRAALGIVPEVVSGEEEARLSFAGSLLGTNDDAPAGGDVRGPRLVVDLGGGSTELVLGVDAPQAACSLNTGSVRITERYLADGVTPAAEEAARREVRALLDRAADAVDMGAATRLVGLAGTISTVTAHALGLDAFDREAIDGAELSIDRVLASCDAIVHSTAAQRESWGYLLPGRRDVIAAGALVWSEVVARVAADTAAAGHPLTTTVTSLSDILDGIAVSLASVGEQA
ncbi:MAG: exopolyphosphatase [Actinomyces ruminicola]|uniref:Exopolyphosphatase / guanosine-5'-triphosphate,3'-diphosphate pyrophosphatase n=1 Tax=Actinomyces ruminicola TaxID=332524 RepID=A0A1G9X895_9ACTO|nr:exopolyphosphatase [Actinomyces ruminicola]MBE6480903.1 exopolyphosphatase [Actinomyces ruminicola]SDM92696.1 exopolyphosphatase / guanosine-5'-triphosphate,3'-diphosphate pyrophosphatase [Actinomyces ruminicola]